VSAAVLLPISFFVLLAGALLFVNAIEWLGVRLSLAQGAVGSLLAAVATALPESLIPITAIIAGGEGAEEVATGAILGAPFLLATLAMALVGVCAYLWRRQRPQGTGLAVHFPTLERDLAFFVGCFGFAFLLGVVGAPQWLRIVAALLLVLAYGMYVRLTLAGAGDVSGEEELSPLIMDRTRNDPPNTITIVVQCVVALGAIIGGAHLFVEQITEAAKSLGVSPLLLSLVIAPFATELPEKANSVFWVREGKDTLALGNITGAMVFQSTLPVAVGLAFTDWDFETPSIVACALALVGGLLAIFELQFQRRFHPRAIVGWSLLFLAFVVYAVTVA
jgi:cation:H+ antiporter